ncbi:MAG: PEP-CTERM sorting domain-containing protein [Phycisphaeraceae bacterium]
MTKTTMTLLAASAATALMASASSAAIIPLYTEAAVADLGDVWNATVDAGDGSTFGIELLDAGTVPASPFGTGNALRLYDFSTEDKPELQKDLDAPITGAFRVDFSSFDNSVNDSSSAIRFRMANTGDSISSESRSAFSLSWQADGEVTAKSEGGFGSVATKSSDALVGVQQITMVGNAAVAGNYDYTLFGVSRSLNPQSYDVYINGVLFNDSSDADEINGLEFTLTKSAGNYDPALGLGRLGLIGSSNSNVDPDVFYDNIILRTGDDVIPEPASALLLGLGAMALRRR